MKADPDRPICRRCFLEELGQTDLVSTLEELKLALSPEEKTDDNEYAKRLDICRSCTSLNNGTCTECGCYVEFRALRAVNHCPHVPEKW